MEWLGLKHPMLVHLPLAAALLLPLPLLLAQRAGRGIRPWWIACRYLGWAAFLGLLATVPSGHAWGRGLGHLGGAAWMAPKGSPLRIHQLLGLASLALSLGMLWSLHRRRKDHEGLGWAAFLLGAAFAVVTVLAGLRGHRLTRGPAQPMVAAAPVAVPSPEPPDPERDRPVRALDFAALQPVGAEPVRSQAHGGRFVRVWLSSAAAVEAYQTGQPLPAGTFAVLSSQEPRWGRPGPEAGPLWAYELATGGKPVFQLYWGRIPESQRAEFEGKERVYWRKDAPQLQACATCHAAGASDAAQRSRGLRPGR
jgi:hypothetical protein